MELWRGRLRIERGGRGALVGHSVGGLNGVRRVWVTLQLCLLLLLLLVCLRVQVWRLLMVGRWSL